MLIEVAGVPLEVNCRYAENERLFTEYETHKPPFFSIAPTVEDLKRMQVNHFILAQARVPTQGSGGRCSATASG